ncbi:MAG: TauD/TfdA family dioxygenase [Gammaproteobacteria bacterium]|nr:TauD/TfdA family dioxygenase [Gammaproteobacteria bacterium]
MQKNTALNPFDLDDNQAYCTWREQKLANYPVQASELIVNVEDPFHLSVDEKTALHRACRRANMAIYDFGSDLSTDKVQIKTLGQQMGLERLDGNLCSDSDQISSLHVVEQGRHAGYIPYTNRPIQWHTDGYYNKSDEQIRGMILHCVHAAEAGGENALLDHEIAYILLRDENPAFIKALMQPDVMTIPANIENGVEIRAAQSGPVFSVDLSGNLHMRYTARTRSIEWKQDSLTQSAVKCLRDLLFGESPHIYHLRLISGQGLICNNVLHNRATFSDGDDPLQQRMLYRARYFDRIQAI